MNTDLLTEDLKKARSSNQSFWLMGQPDIEVRVRKDGFYEVEVNGFDYFDTVKGELMSGGKGKIAVWLLDTDYDERSLFPRQVFFLDGRGEGRVAQIEQGIVPSATRAVSRVPRHGVVAIRSGRSRKIAVVVDDRVSSRSRLFGWTRTAPCRAPSRNPQPPRASSLPLAGRPPEPLVGGTRSPLGRLRDLDTRNSTRRTEPLEQVN